ncbi:MAG: GTP-binding protein [Christensenellaceae bacterium]|jgi:G3E family GTPase|nr:GTP-binding protein [Christensenellaceae bacterium]
MTKIDIFSGFLGAGKTTLIKKLIAEAYAGEKLVLIENEFGEIGIDSGFLQEAGITITEMNSGCICCSLVGDFSAALKQVLEQYHPDRILIEPSGVGKLSDVIRAVQGIGAQDIALNSFTTVVDASKCKLYMKNFGEFFNDQVECANCIVLSRTASLPEEKLLACVAQLQARNPKATFITTPWDTLSGGQILDAMEHRGTLNEELEHLLETGEVCPACGHVHDGAHHHDHDHEHHHEHEHNHEHEHEHAHEHAHDHEHEHDHHHHHDADEVFGSWGLETAKAYTTEQLQEILHALESAKYGQVLRAKGIVRGQNGGWLHFDYVPGEAQVREGGALVTGRLCVIGAQLDTAALGALFGA